MKELQIKISDEAYDTLKSAAVIRFMTGNEGSPQDKLVKAILYAIENNMKGINVKNLGD